MTIKTKTRSNVQYRCNLLLVCHDRFTAVTDYGSQCSWTVTQRKKNFFLPKSIPMSQCTLIWGQIFFRVAQISKNTIGHVFSFKIVFMWVLSRHCLLGKLATISYKTGTQNQKFLNQKTWPMLFFDVSETPKKI